MLKKEESLISNSLIPINVRDTEFHKLIALYEKALNKLLDELYILKEYAKEIYEYDLFNTITSRIKTPKSILNKMKRKNYELNYKNLVQNIDDIAGIRISCPLKTDIFTIKELIERVEDIRVIEEKDYISSPKESGYSAYHLIVEVPIEFKDKEIYIKCEIQIRTMAMDFWATTEHKMRYKSKKKISWLDSKKLTWYAKIINILDTKLSNLYAKQ